MLKYPFQGEPIVTNTYRNTKYNPHYGVDYALSHRTAIVACANGKVSKLNKDETRSWLANTESDPFKPVGFPLRKRALRTEDYGNYIKIDHGSNISTLYAHLDEVVVYQGQVVGEGQLIGYADSTGNSSGNHIHHEIRVNDRVVDPDWFFKTYPNFTGEGGVEGHKFYPLKKSVTVAGFVDILWVRSEPIRKGTQAKPSNLSGSMELTAGDVFRVDGFVEGEEIDGNPYWWKSTKGNYVWSGGTVEIPDPKDFPPSIEDKITERQKIMEELRAELERLETARDVELAEVAERHREAIEAAKAALEEAETAVPVEEEVEAVEEEVEAEAAEEAEEEVAEEVTEEPAEEVVEEEAEAVEEEVSPNADEIAALEARLAELRGQ